jgi:hypothetical protein
MCTFCVYVVYNTEHERAGEGGTEGGRGCGATKSVICPHLRYYSNTNCFCHLLLLGFQNRAEPLREQFER